MTRIKYPNPSFFGAKDKMDWKAQGENLKEIGSIIGEMVKEADWKAFLSRQGKNLKSDLERVKSEAAVFANMYCSMVRNDSASFIVTKIWRRSAGNGAESVIPVSISMNGFACGGCCWELSPKIWFLL